MLIQNRVLRVVVAVLSVAMVLFQIWYVYRPTISPQEGANLHLGFGLSLVYLFYLQRAKRWSAVLTLGALLAVSLFVTAYVGVFYKDLIDRIGIASQLDLVVGVLMIVAVLEATRLAFGWAIPAFAILTLAYAYFGAYMPGFLLHGGFSAVRLIGNMTTYLTGVYSSVLQVSSSLIAIFMIFGGFLNACYASNYFIKLALQATRRTRAGPALAAVGASALFGSINGSPVANVTTTGIFTIPLMKRHGFRPDFAAATEAVASTGGTLMPPVMGVAAFLMASITGIPYIHIAAHALVPSIIFFGSVAIAIFVATRKSGLRATTLRLTHDPKATMLLEGMTFFIPFALIVGLMIVQYPITLSALVGTAALVVLAVAREAAYRWTPYRPPADIAPQGPAGELADAVAARDGLAMQLLNGAIDGAINAARIAVVCATLGIIIHAFTMTGMAGRIVHNMSDVAGGSLMITLLIIAGVSLLFGLGVPTVGSYVIVAVLGAPLMTKLGVDLLAAHMFILYFTMLSGLTPPVGTTVLVAAQIADASYWRSALTSMTIAMPGFVVPFLYVYEPALLGFGDLTTVVWTSMAVLGGVYAFTAAIENFGLVKCLAIERVAMAAAAAVLFVSGVVGVWAAIVGAAAVLGVLVLQNRRSARLQAA